jgi:hypothetical protein
MSGDERLLAPAEAVEFLKTYRGVNITVDILRQMRQKGRVKGISMGKRMTGYYPRDLLEADITRHDPGRPRTNAE